MGYKPYELCSEEVEALLNLLIHLYFDNLMDGTIKPLSVQTDFTPTHGQSLVRMFYDDRFAKEIENNE